MRKGLHTYVAMHRKLKVSHVQLTMTSAGTLGVTSLAHLHAIRVRTWWTRRHTQSAIFHVPTRDACTDAISTRHTSKT